MEVNSKAIKGYKFRIYPTSEQEIVLKKTIGCCRYIYNYTLAMRREAWKNERKSVSFGKTSAAMTQLRKHPETKWLGEVSYRPLQQALLNLEEAYSRFFKGVSSCPKFKKRKKGGSARFTRESFGIKNGSLRIARIKTLIKVVWSRKLPSSPSSCVVSRNPSGQWFVSFTCETENAYLPKVDKKVGIDLGIETFATLSDGRKIKQPDSIRKARRKLARSHRSLSRKKRGSNNRNKARVKLARDYQKVANISNDFQHKLSTQLIRENQTIVIEDLTVSNMMQKGNRKLARLIGEQGWFSFRRMLKYKAENRGRELIVIDRFAPTSQTCNTCGKTNKVSLDKRAVTCECGVTYDRDANAALNILAVGTTVSACGTGVRLPSRKRSVSKQEPLLLAAR